jgi:outer membrane translocation and assembly module TamA
VNLAEWYRARKRLYDTGVFRRADVRPERIGDTSPDSPDEEPVRAHVEVEEWPQLRLQYGVQIVDELKPAGDARQFGLGLATDFTRRNLFGRAATAGLSVRYTGDAQVGRAFARAPRFFGLPIASNLFASQSHERRAAETARPLLIDLTDFTAEQRVRPLRTVELAYGASFQRNHTFREPDPDDPIPFDVILNIARVTFTGLIDTRDDLVSPGRGWFHSSSFEYGTELDSKLRFVRYFGQGAYYRALGGGIVIATGARLGLGSAFGNELLSSERFFAGGGRSIRGYGEDSIGPRDFLGFPTGGEALVVLNEEIRVPIYRWVGGVGFFDTGNVFASRDQFTLRDLRSSAGFGLRLSTPLGLLRVDAGVPLRRQPDERRLRWIFSVGQTF